jgi:hypothetical protein
VPVTLVLCAPVAAMLPQLEDGAREAFCRLRSTLAEGRVLPGGGAFELCCAAVLRNAAQAAEATLAASAAGVGAAGAGTSSSGGRHGERSSERRGDGTGASSSGTSSGMAPRDAALAAAPSTWQGLNAMLRRDAETYRPVVLRAAAAAFERVVLTLLQNAGLPPDEAAGRLLAATRILNAAWPATAGSDSRSPGAALSPPPRSLWRDLQAALLGGDADAGGLVMDCPAARRQGLTGVGFLLCTLLRNVAIINNDPGAGTRGRLDSGRD